MRIWLDDVRKPPSTEWEWCKDHVAFLAAIQYPPIVEHVAFDHDLGEWSKDGSWCAGVLAEKSPGEVLPVSRLCKFPTTWSGIFTSMME